jgi:hypothetical protein
MTLVLMSGNKLRHSDHIHTTFFLKAFCQLGYEVVLYGRGAQAHGTEALPFCPDRTIEEVLAAVKPDILFGWRARGTRLFDWPRLDVPTIAYLPDFHYVKDLTRYHNTDVLIVRAKFQLDYARGLPGYDRIRCIHWLPFSFDPDFVVNQPFDARKLRVVFRGVAYPDAYPLRVAVLEKLQAAGLIDAQLSRKPVREYFDDLSGYAIGLCASGRWAGNPAKETEIAAAGCVLLTDGRGQGLPVNRQDCLLFTEDNIVDVVREALLDPTRLKQMAQRSSAHVWKHHTDDVRTCELGQLFLQLGFPTP